MTRPIIVALHGVGSSGRDMEAALAPLTANFDLVALDGSEPFDGAAYGRQWFSVQGVTEADRPQRVINALPALIERLDIVANDHHVTRENLVLLGFSQGAIMTLAMVAQGLHSGRAVALAGRLASTVMPIGSRPASLLVIADTADHVMPPGLSQDAAERLRAAGHHVDLSMTEGIGHSIGLPTLSLITDWLVATAPVQTHTTTNEG